MLGSMWAAHWANTYYFLAPIGSLDVSGTPTPFDMIPRTSLSDGGAADPQAIELSWYLGAARILDNFDATNAGVRDVIAMGSGVRIRLRNDNSAYIEINSETTRRPIQRPECRAYLSWCPQYPFL